MSEKKIPAPAYIIIGAGIILMSVFIDISKLSFFVFVGAVFIVIGFFKILIKEKKGGEAHRAALHTRAEERALNQGHAHAQHPAHPGAHHAVAHQSHLASSSGHAAQAHQTNAAHAHATPEGHAHSAHQQSHAPSQVQHSQVFRCSSCGVKLHPMFKFCPRCGQKLK